MSSLDSLGRTKSSRSRAGIPSTASRLSDFVKSLIAIDSKPPFHLPRRKRQPRGSDETLDKVFQGLLKEANRELASLLRDVHSGPDTDLLDRKSTRLNSSHVEISYAVFCLKKKNEASACRGS